MIEGIRSALVVAAHPDDELLGCGGTVARLAGAGCRVETLILATGATSRAEAGQSEVAALADAARNAASVIGAASVAFGGFPDNAMDSVPLLEIVRRVEAAARSGPELVLTHHAGDLNIDHRLTHEAVLTAFRPLPGAATRLILAFETVSSSEWASTAQPAFRPNYYVPLTTELDRKLEALACYESEMRPFPHPRSTDHVRNLARVRGAEIGVPVAEAYMVLRGIAS